MQAVRDPMGRAIADYHRDGKAARLRVFSPMFDEDEIPVATLFRTLDEMPDIEREALLTAAGAILDVGAGAGCHALALQAMEKHVTAIDISPLAVATMRERGVKDVREQDFFTLDGPQFDTILIDGEAGIEQINRQVTDKVNTLILVTDSSYRGLQTVRHIEGLVKDGSVPLCDRMGVIVNRVIGDKRSAEELAEQFKLPIFGVIPYDPVVEEFDREGRSLLELPEESVALKAVRDAVGRINGAA